MIGKTLIELAGAPDIAERIESQLRRAVAERQSVVWEQDFPVASGLRHIEYFMKPLLLEDDSVGCVVSSGRDITDKKQAQADMKESRIQVIDILESISDGFCALDSLWRLTYINKKAQQLMGFKKEELLFKVIWEKFPSTQALHLYKELINASEHKQATSFEELMPASNRWFEFHVYPYDNGLSIYFSEITERKQAELELQKSKKLSDALNDINATINSTHNANAIMNSVVAEACQAIGAESATIALHEGDSWEVRYGYGDLAPGLDKAYVRDADAKGTLFAIREKTPLAIGDAYADSRVNNEIMNKFGIRALLIVPLPTGESYIGVIFFHYYSAARVFSTAEVDFATKLASAVSLALENARLYEKVIKLEE